MECYWNPKWLPLRQNSSIGNIYTPKNIETDFEHLGDVHKLSMLHDNKKWSVRVAQYASRDVRIWKGTLWEYDDFYVVNYQQKCLYGTFKKFNFGSWTTKPFEQDYFELKPKKTKTEQFEIDESTQ